MSELLIAIILVTASFAGTGLIVYAIQSQRKRVEAFAALAERRGWQFAHHPGNGIKPTRSEFRGGGTPGWTLTIFVRHSQSNASQSGGGSVRRWVEFEDASVPLAEGVALLGPEIPASAAAMAQSVLGGLADAQGMGGKMGRMMLEKITGGLGEEALGLKVIASGPDGTLMASPGQELALAPVRGVPEFVSLRKKKNSAEGPVLLRGPFGFRIRRTVAPRKPQDVEELVELGQALVLRIQSAENH